MKLTHVILAMLVFPILISCGSAVKESKKDSDLDFLVSKQTKVEDNGAANTLSVTLQAEKIFDDEYCVKWVLSNGKGEVLEVKGTNDGYSEGQLKEILGSMSYATAFILGIPVGALIGAYALFEDSWYDDSITLKSYKQMAMIGAFVGFFLVPVSEYLKRNSNKKAIQDKTVKKLESKEIRKIIRKLEETSGEYPGACRDFANNQN